MISNSLYTTIKNEASLWGSLFQPKKPKPPKDKGLKVVLFVSCECGILMLEQLAKYESLYPEKLNLVGVVTDDPIDPAARISIKKRIWSQFSQADRQLIFNRMIDTSAALGLSCYSGAVKTDYFRQLYAAWQPEALLMFCFGQWIDSKIFDFPKYGSFNFHPSDLPKKVGAGTQPFQNAIQLGLKSAPMVIHRVTELIDIGPIVGMSSYINICLADGSYPSNIRTLLDKLTSIGGWMGVALVEALINAKDNGLISEFESIDFQKIMPPDLIRALDAPAVNDLNEKYALPLHKSLEQPKDE